MPGFAIDRMCAGAMTAVTTTASGIGFGAYDVVIAGGVEHMGNHPMGAGADPNPRFMSERIVDPAALNMGNTAENLHDRFPAITKDRTDAYAVASPGQARRSLRQRPDPARPRTRRHHEAGPGLDRQHRGRAAAPGHLARRTWPRCRRRSAPTAGSRRATPPGLNDGATAALLASADAAEELGLPVKMRLVSYAFAGVEPEVMGIGPVPATEKALKNAGLGIGDIGLFEINEAFAVQVLSFLDHFGIADDDPRVNRYGGAIAVGHPLASSGVRLMNQLARQFEEDPSVRFGMTTMCIGLGMGATVIWENPHHADYGTEAPARNTAEAQHAEPRPPRLEPQHERRRFPQACRPLPERDGHPLLRPGHRAARRTWTARQAPAPSRWSPWTTAWTTPSPPPSDPTPWSNSARSWKG